MKFTHLCSLTALAAYALADDAYLWTIDHGVAKYANTQASSISPETASSIIARRRGLKGDRNLAGADANTLRDVEQFGGYQMPLSGPSSKSSPAKLLIRVSGFTGTISQFPSLPDLWIEDATRDLATDFKARKHVEGLCEYDLTIPTKSGVDIVYSYNPEGSSCMTTQQLQMEPTILVLFSTVPTAAEAPEKMNTLIRSLSHLAVTADIETTLLILPPTSKLQKVRSGRRADPSESPLELNVEASEKSSASTTSSSSATRYHPLPSVIPQCFASLESCENTTNSCSGHGSCYKSHGSCYKCGCKATVAYKNDDGSEKTIQWGGNACQKKDVSMEFILFASFGVIFMGLIAGAIGGIYTMGSQDLPSVLSAGVGGSSKQK